MLLFDLSLLYVGTLTRSPRRKGLQRYRLYAIDAHAVNLFHRDVDFKTETTLTCRGVIGANCRTGWRDCDLILLTVKALTYYKQVKANTRLRDSTQLDCLV